MKWIACVALSLALLCCGGRDNVGRGRAGNNAVVFLKVAEPDASIWVDGKFVGEVAQARGGVSVSPGTHRIEIRHDRHHSYYKLIEVGPKQRLTLDVELAEELP